MPTEDVKVCVVGGGHLTPALATIESLLNHQIKCVFVGRKTTDIYKSVSKESQEVSRLGIDFEALSPPKYYRKPVHKNLTEISKIGQTIQQTLRILNKHQPDLVLCFGGYVSLPIAIVAWLKGIPVLTHEQTMVLGRTNQCISRFAKTAISWPETQGRTTKMVLTGNPVRKAILDKPSMPKWFKSLQLPLIYVTGGNQGAQIINQWVLTHLEQLLESYQIVHQTGDARKNQDIELALNKQRKLSPKYQSRYYPKTWMDQEEVSWLLQNADLVISRAGANTVTELLIHQTRSILIPLPIAARNEQRLNAQLAQQIGIGRVLEQSNIDQLPDLIKVCLAEPQKFSRTGKKLQRLHIQAADKLAELVLSCVKDLGE